MILEHNMLFTGANGLLGSKLKELLPNSLFTDLEDFDVTDYSQMKDYIEAHTIELLFHAAAFTSPPLIDKDPLTAIETNIIGTSNVVKLCMEYNIRLIYISTDYVFKGDVGNYREEDPVYPVNKYAWSKLGGECAVRLYDNALIIRTSFGPDVFQFEKAFTDQWTSRESVSRVAEKFVKLIKKDITGTVHVGGERRTVYQYACDLDKEREIGILSINDVNFVVPVDTSLDCSKYAKVITE